MLRRIGIGITVLAASLLVVSSVAGANVHLKGGPRAEPSFTDLGRALAATGELSGLGNADIEVNMTATGNVTSVCINPSGGTQPPGQNPAPITLTGTQTIPASEVKNGTVVFNVQTTEAPATIAGAPDCPNPRWTEAITGVAFTSATITIEQPPGTTVLTISCTLSPPTSDGAVPAGNVTCTQS
jgi:hypothetical protein